MKLSTMGIHKRLHGGDLVTLDEVQLRKLHQVLLSIADDIIGFCEREGLEVQMGGGTLLGAVRYGGFIPWDDDIDLNMPRDSFDKFVREFPREFGDRYWIHDPVSHPELGLPFCKVRLKGTALGLPWEEPFEDGIFVDLFPMEDVPDNPLRRLWRAFSCYAHGFLLSCRRFWAKRSVYRELAADNPEMLWPSRIKGAVGLLISWRSYASWTRACDRSYKAFADHASRNRTFPSGRGHYLGELQSRDVFEGSSYVSFEGRVWPAPHDVDRYLSRLYGPDYASAPPERDREHHGYSRVDFGEGGVAHGV